MLKRLLLSATGLGVLVFVTACSPPDQPVLDLCRQSANADGKGHDLTAADLGELTETCMAERGFKLIRAGKRCSHDLESETNRLCYFPDTMLGRFRAWLPQL